MSKAMVNQVHGPNRPKGAPEGTIWFGGQAPWFSVSLSIYKKGLDVDAISQILGVQPDVSGKAISRTSGGSMRKKSWSIRVHPPEGGGGDLSTAIEGLLDRATQNSAAWNTAIENAQARLSLGLELDGPNRGIRLEPALIERLGMLKIFLDIDIYGGPPADGHS